MKKVIVLFFSFCYLRHGVTKGVQTGIDFEDCGGKLDLVTISISSCPSIPCKVQKGNIVEVTIEFDPRNSPQQATTLLFDAYWALDGRQQQALLLPDFCDISGCIRSAPSGLLTFTAGVYVSDSLPRGTSGYLHWRTTYANNGDLLLCSRIPVYIY